MFKTSLLSRVDVQHPTNFEEVMVFAKPSNPTSGEILKLSFHLKIRGESWGGVDRRTSSYE